MKDKTENKKFIQLTTAAQRLLMQHGIRRVTVEEICREAKVSKMTFYKHFNNKIDLAKYILKAFFNKSMDKYRGIMAKQISFPEKVRQIVQLEQKNAEMYTQEFFNDLFKNPDPRILELMKKMTTDANNEVLRDFKNAQANGDIRKGVNPEFILFFLNHMTEMVKDERLSKHYTSHEGLIMELTNFFFYGILPADQSPEAHE